MRSRLSWARWWQQLMALPKIKGVTDKLLARTASLPPRPRQLAKKRGQAQRQTKIEPSRPGRQAGEEPDAALHGARHQMASLNALNSYISTGDDLEQIFVIL